MVIDEYPKETIWNIAGREYIRKSIGITTVTTNIGLDSVEYEPEQFPVLIYRPRTPKVIAYESEGNSIL